MMNRNTQRELIKLLWQLNDICQAMDWQNQQQKNMVLDILGYVCAKCSHDFSRQKAEQYEEILQGLGHVIQDMNWNHMQAAEKRESLNLFQDIITQLTDNLRHEQEIKKEIVFLPYKVSMWDSLESIWQAAYTDKEHCNTYVIPIPYCERNADFSIAKWYWEKDQFPDYVPTLDCRLYTWEKLKEMEPDVIFIHNPYDGCNIVTSIDEQYYSANLKKCTKLLIYIPYFITKWKVDVAKCNAPGVVNADYVIVQDELIGKWYKEHYMISEDRDKFIVLGSPKVDKVRNAKKCDYPLPTGWTVLMENKYVIFFNITFHGFLKHNNEFLQHLKRLFTALEHNPKILLWWRPHPLLDSGLKSIHPELVMEYQNLKAFYLKKKIGLYDEFPDFYPGFVWSDAYYGDESSLFTLYQCMGKPTRLINYEEENINNIEIVLEDIIKQIETGTIKLKRNVNDTIPHHAGVNIYNWVKNMR